MIKHNNIVSTPQSFMNKPLSPVRQKPTVNQSVHQVTQESHYHTIIQHLVVYYCTVTELQCHILYVHNYYTCINFIYISND